MIDAFINFRVDSIMDRSRSLKRPSDGEPSGDSQRQRMEGQISRGFGLGPAGRDHLRFTGTATIHLNLDIESLFKEIEQRQDIATQRHKAHDQASSRKPGREVRLFGVNIADGPGRQQQEASSSRQPFGWQGQEAFHLAQSHQEIGRSSQPEVINEQMPLEISSDSDSEPSHERIHHQAGSSHQRDILEEHKRKKRGIASGKRSPQRGHGAEKLTEDLMKDPDYRAKIEKQARELAEKSRMKR
jgi:hypothetical protein